MTKTQKQIGKIASISSNNNNINNNNIDKASPLLSKQAMKVKYENFQFIRKLTIK